MLLGLVAMFVHDYRILIRILHIPGLFAMIYFWLIPESARWLLVNGRFDQAVTILKRIAKVNRKELSEKSIELLRLEYTMKSEAKSNPDEKGKTDDTEARSVIQSLGMIFKSKTFSVRFLNCCFQWIACAFTYYGLSLGATHIPGADRYVSFIIVMASEIPGMFSAQPLLTRMKRRVLMFSTMLFGAIFIIAPSFIPKEYSLVVLLCFMLGKALITCAFTVLYVYTMEQWPTNIRSTVINLCSMVGRIGSMTAPLTMILVRHDFELKGTRI